MRKTYAVVDRRAIRLPFWLIAQYTIRERIVQARWALLKGVLH